ncbi:hypothetical protein OTU49_000907 [Cherax quadricarinatus]|uniref:Leishmanolysin-like peptidase n=1 Tax=Cherax quadricarinatus TaxID=27406 RepID=A0AAW0XHB4_CHEQU
MEIFHVWWLMVVITVPHVYSVPLKVHVDYVDRHLPPRLLQTFKKTFLAIAELISLKNTYNKTVFHIPREKSACGSTYYDGLNFGKCAKISRNYIGDFCGDIKIPPEHLEGLKVYDYDSLQPLNKSLPEGKGFDDGTNFVVYLTSRASRLCQYSVAHSVVCRSDLGMVGGVTNGRPLAGVVNLCETKIEYLSDIVLRRIIAHEAIHLLGFNYRSIQEFIACDPEEEEERTFSNCDSTDISERNISASYSRSVGNNSMLCWKQKDVLKIVRGNEVILHSTHIEFAALQMDSYSSEEYECLNMTKNKNEESNSCFDMLNTTESKPAAYENISKIFEEYGGIRLARTRTGIHWSHELFTDIVSVMVPGDLTAGRIVIDPLTLALMKTSGWYNINRNVLVCVNCFLNIESDLEGCVKLNRNTTFHFPQVDMLFEEQDSSVQKKENYSMEFKNFTEPSHSGNSSQETLIQARKQSIVKEMNILKDINSCENLSSEGTKLYSLYLHMVLGQILIVGFFQCEWVVVCGTVVLCLLPILCRVL